MKVKNILFQGFKGFEAEQHIKFQNDVNLFIGGNGAGKTSLLLAILKSFNPLINRIMGSANSVGVRDKVELISEDINYKSIHSSISIFLKYNEEGPLSHTVGLEKREILQNFPPGEVKVNVLNFFLSLVNGKLTLPILKMYPANRSTALNVKLNDPAKFDIFASPQLRAWSNIYQSNLSYAIFFKWFNEYQQIELSEKFEKNNLEHEIKELKYIRVAVSKLYEELEGEPVHLMGKKINLSRSNELIDSLILKYSNGYIEDINNKSDGEKTIITLVADIAYTLSIASETNADKNYLEGPGVVLIDEIEAHLHPNWQRKIIPLLRSIFPNIQFFITTHSPQVISSVSSDKVFMIDDYKVKNICFKTLGIDSNSLLEQVFGSTERPEVVVKLIDKFNKALDKEVSYEELEAIIQEIEAYKNQDKGATIDPLIDELRINLNTYKYDLENEIN